MPAVAGSERVQAVFDDAIARRTRAGGLATTADGELGVIASARFSPNGEWTVIVDATPPHVKLFDRRGVLVFALQSPPNEESDIGYPTAAVSDRELLVVWPNSRLAQVYDLRGRLLTDVGNLDFLAVAATAIINDVWLVYGPTIENSPMVDWIHCGYRDASGKIRWASSFKDSLAGGLESRPWFPLFVTASSALIQPHRGGDLRLISAGCLKSGVSAELSQLRHLSPETDRSRALPVGAEDALFDFVQLGEGGTLMSHEGPNSSIIFNADPKNFTVFHRLDSQNTVIARIQGAYELVDARAVGGLLFATRDPVPRVFSVETDRLKSALTWSEERLSHERR